MMIELKQVFSGKRLEEVHALYETAFPACEKKPFSMITAGQETGLVEILAIEENNGFLGLAIMAKAGDRVLLDYFAIADQARGHGVGSAALRALRGKYQGMRLIIEIESTKCVDEEELFPSYTPEEVLSPEWVHDAALRYRSLGNRDGDAVERNTVLL